MQKGISMKKMLILAVSVIFFGNAMDSAPERGNSKMQLKIAQSYIAYIKDSGYEIEPHWDILDIGCGTGEFSHWLAGKVPNGLVVGVDRSRAKIEAAQQKLQSVYAGTENLSFEVENMEEQPEDKVDAITCFAMMYLNKEKKAALARIAQSLEPGGIFISTWLRSKQQLKVSEEKSYNDHIWSRLDSFAQDSQFLEALLREAGLEPTIKPVVQQQDFSTDQERNDLVNELLSFMPGYDAFPPELRNKYVEVFTDNYLQRVPEKERTYNILGLLAIAQKKST